MKKLNASKKLSKTKKPAAGKRLAVPAHAHPYGLNLHRDLDWHTEKFQKSLKRLPADGQTSVTQAYNLARERHTDQVRQGGSPYIIHPIRIANILMSEWNVRNGDIVAAAILHDVVEDTATTIKEVKDLFGENIGKLVDGMTMWKGSETYELYCKRLARGSEQLRLIKCADVLDNLRSWHEIEALDGLPRWWRQVNDQILPIADITYQPAAVTIRALLNDRWFLKMAKME